MVVDGLPEPRTESVEHRRLQAEVDAFVTKFSDERQYLHELGPRLSHWWHSLEDAMVSDFALHE
jgi:hypothetical protein